LKEKIRRDLGGKEEERYLSLVSKTNPMHYKPTFPENTAAL